MGIRSLWRSAACSVRATYHAEDTPRYWILDLTCHLRSDTSPGHHTHHLTCHLRSDSWPDHHTHHISHTSETSSWIYLVPHTCYTSYLVYLVPHTPHTPYAPHPDRDRGHQIPPEIWSLLCPIYLILDMPNMLMGIRSLGRSSSSHVIYSSYSECILSVYSYSVYLSAALPHTTYLLSAMQYIILLRLLASYYAYLPLIASSYVHTLSIHLCLGVRSLRHTSCILIALLLHMTSMRSLPLYDTTPPDDLYLHMDS